MSEISQHVGQRIKKYRKSRGLTIAQFAEMISKSNATVSKYENGTIAIDIDTLLDVSEALEVELSHLIDYKSAKVKPEKLPDNFYFCKHTYYMYYYDGRIKKLVRSRLALSASQEDKSCIDIRMYNGLDSFRSSEQYHHIFTGTMRPYDTITHMYLTNQINPTERMYICTLNPLHANSPSVGILSGLGSNPFFAPIAIKAIISDTILEENENLINALKLTKEDIHLLKSCNMMVINRSSSFFGEDLSQKK